jgi:hypothetical protein
VNLSEVRIDLKYDVDRDLAYENYRYGFSHRCVDLRQGLRSMRESGQKERMSFDDWHPKYRRSLPRVPPAGSRPGLQDTWAGGISRFKAVAPSNSLGVVGNATILRM